MAQNGLSGFVDGIIKGIQPGLVIGDAIATRRSAGRMQELQDRIDAGEFDKTGAGTPYADSAAAQLALQEAARRAQAPMSSRGLDRGQYGDDQYARLLKQQQLRGDQRGGAQINAGDLAGGLQTSGRESAALGNIPGAMQAGQTAGQVTAGTSAVGADGVVNQEALARGVSANNARYGDAAGAAAWGAQQKSQADAAIQGMGGKALTILSSPALGGLEGAVPYIAAMSKLAGYGDVQWSPSTKTAFIVDAQGQPQASIDEKSAMAFLQTIGNDPEKILPAIRASQMQTVQDQRDAIKTQRDKGFDARLDVAKQWTPPPSGSPAAAAQQRADMLTQKAQLAGWKIDTGTGMDVTDASGNVVGKKWFTQAPGGGPPLVIAMMNPDPSNPANAAFTVTNQQGQPVDMAGAEGSAVAMAVQAQQAQAQAMQMSLQYNQQRQLQQQAGISDVLRTGSAGGPSAMGGASPALPPALRDYQSPNADLNDPQAQLESGNDQGAVSPKGAQGVRQLLPATREELEQEFGLPAGLAAQNSPAGRAANDMLGQVYRDRLIDGYTQKTGNETQGRVLGLMAYNWGMGNVNEWLASGADPKKVPSETKNYVAKLVAPKSSKRATSTNSGIMGTLSAAEKDRSRAAMMGQEVQTKAVPAALLPNGASSKYLSKG